MNSPKAHILIIEDDPAICNGLSDVLVFNGYAADGVKDGGQGLDRALAGSYDLVLLDVMLPTVDGVTICKTLRSRKPNQPIIMLTAKGAEEDVINGFKAGADDYLSKPFSLRELMVRVEALLRRSGKHVGNERVRCRDIVFDGQALQASRGPLIEEITRREMDIVIYLDRNRHRIVSKQELLSEVWHYTDASIETRTVDIHMLKLRKKISRLDASLKPIETVRGEGYRWSPD